MQSSSSLAVSRRAFVLALTLVALGAGASAQIDIIHVDDDPPPGGMNNGDGWDNAYDDLSAALGDAHDRIDLNLAQSVQVWVAEGTYYPSAPPRSLAHDGTSRGWTFEVHEGVELYGGFTGTEADTIDPITQRGGEPELTFLDGDIGILGDVTDNAYSVVRVGDAAGTTMNQRIDGFTVRNGRANDALGQDDGRGGGLRVWNATGLLVANCIFTNNTAREGGGACVWGSQFEMKLCIFDENNAYIEGGGMHVHSTSGPTSLHSVIFRDNQAGFPSTGTDQGVVDGWLGGGICVHLARERLTVLNGLFHHNAAGRGGAVYLGANGSGTDPGTSWINCTVTRNLEWFSCHYNLATMIWDCTFEGAGAAFYVEEGGRTHDIVNSIIWNNLTSPLHSEVLVKAVTATFPDVDYCDLETATGTWPGTGNLDVDPRFEAPGSGGATLRATSPCLDVGDNGRIPGDLTDLDDDLDLGERAPFELRRGHPRIFSRRVGLPPIVDMGVHEFLPSTSARRP